MHRETAVWSSVRRGSEAEGTRDRQSRTATRDRGWPGLQARRRRQSRVRARPSKTTGARGFLCVCTFDRLPSPSLYAWPNGIFDDVRVDCARPLVRDCRPRAEQQLLSVDPSFSAPLARRREGNPSLTSTRVRGHSPIDAPTYVSCPSESLLSRAGSPLANNQTLFPGEQEYLDNRRNNVLPDLWRQYLSDSATGSTGYDASALVTAQPNLYVQAPAQATPDLLLFAHPELTVPYFLFAERQTAALPSREGVCALRCTAPASCRPSTTATRRPLAGFGNSPPT